MKRKRVVVASGVFDLLHLGHVKFLEEAKKSGGENSLLVVIVARDSTVERLKGSKPIISEDQRRALVEALKVVDEAVLGFEDMDIVTSIEKIRPDVIAIGHDQKKVEMQVRRVVEERKLPLKVVRIGKFGDEELSSSSHIKRKIIEEYRNRRELPF